jgi:hypothetical protein
VSAVFGRSLALRLIGGCLFVVLAPPSTLGDWTDFAPTAVDNGVWLDVYTTREHNQFGSGGRSSHWTDTYLKQKLTVGSLGYSYDPKFLQYRFTFGGAFSQEDFTSSFQRNTGWRTNTGPEYDTRLTLLPEHFYNLMVFAARYEPMFREQAAVHISEVENRRGASFRYRKKPYFLNTNFVNQTNDFGVTNTEVNQLAVTGRYFLRTKAGNELSFNGVFNPQWFSDSQGLNGSSQEYSGGNTVSVNNVRLTSSVVSRNFNQEAPSTQNQEGHTQNFDSNQFSVYELLNVPLPWGFRSDAYYRYLDEEGTFSGLTIPQERLTNRTNDIRANLVHRFYESLDTGYHFERTSQDSQGGSTTTLLHTVDTTYTKLIPWGRALTGLSVGTGDTNNSGTSDVINETHSGILVPGSFRLLQPNVAREGIVVFLKSPLPPFDLVQLVENVHYVLIPVQNSFEIRLLTLPPRFALPERYDFLVSYTNLGGDFDLYQNTLSNNYGLELFDNQVDPYFSYALVRSGVNSGSFPGNLADTTSYTVGLFLQRGPFRGRGEYQDLEWDVSPYRSWRGELQYVSPITKTTDANAFFTYVSTYYPHGLSQGQKAYTDESETASGYLQQQLSFLTEGLSVNVGGSYSRLSGLVDGDAWSANGYLTWAVGQLQLILGATAYQAQTDATSVVVGSQRENQYYYLRLRRRLL